MEDILLVGYGGHAKSVADCIERSKKFRIVGYTDKKEQQSSYTYLGTDAVWESCFEQGLENVAIGIGYLGKGNLREKLFSSLKAIGFHFPVIADPSAIIAKSAQIGEGTFVGKKAVINAEAVIGKMCIINTSAIVEHECRIKDFSHIAVGTILCGQVEIGEATFIGANTTVIQGQNILSRQLVPAGLTIRGNKREFKV